MHSDKLLSCHIFFWKIHEPNEQKIALTQNDPLMNADRRFYPADIP